MTTDLKWLASILLVLGGLELLALLRRRVLWRPRRGQVVGVAAARRTGKTITAMHATRQQALPPQREVDTAQQPGMYLMTTEQLGTVLGTQLAVARQLEMRRADLVVALAALPPWARQYMRALETNCDPAGNVRAIADLRAQVAVLTNRTLELARELAKRTHAADEIPDAWKEGR